MPRRAEPADKQFYKIGEVAELVGVRPHVLRYWESEFSALRPLKTRGAHRVYSQRDVEFAMRVRRLLHDEGYTIPGARKKLRAARKELRQADPDPGAARELALRAELLAARSDLQALLAAIDERGVTEEPAIVRVEKVVPVTVPARAR